MNDAKYIGLDVHQATISVAVRDSAGKLVMEAVGETKAEATLQFLRGVRSSLHVTLEEGTWAALATSFPNGPPSPKISSKRKTAFFPAAAKASPTEISSKTSSSNSLFPSRASSPASWASL